MDAFLSEIYRSWSNYLLINGVNNALITQRIQKIGKKNYFFKISMLSKVKVNDLVTQKIQKIKTISVNFLKVLHFVKSNLMTLKQLGVN